MEIYQYQENVHCKNCADVGTKSVGNFKDVRVLPHPKFSSILGRPTFSAVRSTFLAEEEAQNVEILPHPKFWPFLGRPLKDVRFYPILNFGHFGAASLVTLFDLPKCH